MAGSLYANNNSICIPMYFKKCHYVILRLSQTPLEDCYIVYEKCDECMKTLTNLIIDINIYQVTIIRAYKGLQADTAIYQSEE